MNYSKKDKFVELVLAHRAIQDIKDDFVQCEGFFDSNNHVLYERIIHSLDFADARISSFLRRSGKGNLEYLKNKHDEEG